MIPGLPDVKMLDSEALSDLLEDNLSPPEITTILVFATNGALFAYASPLPARQLRNLSATYGAAYTSYAKNASSGNLTGVNPASHPSSYVTAQSVSLGDVGSIVFELDGLVAVVTRVADRVLVAAVGPSKLGGGGGRGGGGNDAVQVEDGERETAATAVSNIATAATSSGEPNGLKMTTTSDNNASLKNEETPNNNNNNNNQNQNQSVETTTGTDTDQHVETQYEIDRSADLARLASLNLSASPAILLALESKSAALGRFLGRKLEDLECPEDF